MTEDRHDTTGLPSLDLERIAAYLDGTLAPGERADVERTLASSAEGREVLAEAMRLLGMDDAEEEPAAPRPAPEAPHRRRGRWLLPVLAAAALVTVSLVPLLRSGGDGATWAGVDRLVGGAPTLTGDGWDRHTWTVTRSGTTVLRAEDAAFRAGVLWTDALVAWRSPDPSAAAAHFESIRALVDAVPLGSPAARVTGELATAAGGGRTPAEAAELIREGRERLEALLPAPHLALGAWVESVRLAARAGAGEYLAAAETRRLPDGVESADLPDDVADLLDEALAILDAGDFSAGPRARLADVMDGITARLGG